MAAAISSAAPSPCTRTGHDQHVGPAPPPAEHLEKIAHGRAGGAGDHGDPPHERRQRPLARRIEQPLASQLLTQLAQRQFERAEALRLNRRR